MQNRGTNWLWFPASVLMLLGLSSCSSGKASKAEASSESKDSKEKGVPVQLVTVQSREIRRTVEAVGTLFAYDEVSLSPEVDGRVEKVLVDVGDHVTKGETLVEILPIEYQLAVNQQSAVLQQAQSKLGLPTGETDLTKAASVKKAAADLADAKQRFERTKQLTDQGLLPKQQYDADEAAYNAAQANYDVAVQDARNLQATIQEQSVLKELADKKLRDTHIVEPFDGYVTARNVVIGQYVLHTTSQATAPAPLITVANIDPLRARLKIPEKMSSWVPVGQLVTLTVEAYPGKTFTGKISRINPDVDAQTRTFEAEALVENHERLLKPGFFAKASVDSTEVDRVLFVPQKALSYAYGIYKVYEVGKGNKLKEKEVKLGDHMGDDVELLGGVPEGDRLAIATEGQELAIKDGAVVKVSGGGGGKRGGRGGKGAGDSEKADDGKTKGDDSSGSGSEGSS